MSDLRPEDTEDIIVEKLNQNEDDNMIDEVNTFAPGEVRMINKQVLTKYKIILDECTKPNQLLEVCSNAFDDIARYANSIVNRDILLELIGFAHKIIERLDSFDESSKIENQASVENELYEKMILNLASSFSVIEGQDDSNRVKLTLTGAKGLIGMIKALVTKKLIPAFEETIVSVVLDLSHHIVSSTSDEKLAVNKAQEVHKFITKLRNYNAAKHLEIIQSRQRLSKYTFLALFAKDNADDSPQILSQISNKLNLAVLNDKESARYNNLRYFLAYLTIVDNETFIKDVFAQIEFMMKRNGSLIGIVSQLINHLKSVNFDKNIIGLLTEGIITSDFLVSQDYANDCSDYFRNLASMIKDQEIASALVLDFLLKRFTSSKTQFNVNQRQNMLKHLSASLESTTLQSLISQEQLQVIVAALIEHIFSVKDEPVIKECFESVRKVFLIPQSFGFAAEQVRKLISKANTHWHVTLFVELIAAKKQDLQEVIQICTPHFKQMLSSENFKLVANFSQILSLVGFFVYAAEYTKDQSYVQFLAQNDNILKYLATTAGFINTPTYFAKPPSYLDTKYQLKALEALIGYHYHDQALTTGDVLLRDTLFELVLNQSIKFREHLYLDVIQNLTLTSQQTETVFANLLKSLYLKVKQVSLRPIVLTREDSPHQPNMNVEHQIRLSLKLLLKNKEKELTQNEFFMLLKLISHPYVSQGNKQIINQVTTLKEVLASRDQELQLDSYFIKYGKQIADYAIIQRTGILSSDATLRKQAVNMATALAALGGLNLFLPDLSQILNYKPFEMLLKLENLFKERFDLISHYDLMFYSEITKDLLTVFKNVDQKIYQEELGVDQEQSSSGQDNNQEEEKKQEPVVEAVIDPAKLAAQMLKQQAAMKKAAAAKKGGAASKAPAKAPPKKETKPEPKKQEQAPQQPAMDKETRNKMDRQSLLNYFAQIQTVKAQQIETAYEIVKRINKNGFHLDTTFGYLLDPMIKLLNYTYSKFSTIMCLQQVLKNHKRDPLFAVKNELVSCMVAISQGKIFIKHQREFQAIFQHIEANTNIDSYDKGYTFLIMTMGNYVLKDLSVNLSVKEQALSVIQSFLSTDKVQDIELVRVTINMMKSSYNSPNLQPYLNELMRRLKPEYIALILQRLFEYEPTPRMALLKELVEYDQPLFCPIWMATQFWVLQFDDDCNKLARKIWNKYGMSLRNGVIDLASEQKHKNVYLYLRSGNTNIYDATLKSTIAAIEIFQNRFDLIIDDLIEFYNQEIQIIENESLINSLQAQQSTGRGRNMSAGFSTQKLLLDDRLNRIAVPEILTKTAHLVQANSFKKIYEYFVTKGCLDQNEQVAKANLNAALQIIKAKGSDYSEEILKILENFINESKKYSEQSKNQAIIMIGSLAQYLDNTSQKKLVGTFEKMLELLNTPSELIRQSICKVIPQLARYFDDKSRKFLEVNFQILRTSMDEKLLRGSAFAVAGIIKGLGMQTIQQIDLLSIVQKECFFKNADPLRKVAALFLYETLSLSLGKVFEMNIVVILPNIMLCISDHKENVRRAAIQANKTIMGNLSNHAIKQVLPIFLNGLYNDNWRSKLASVEALGNMAFCAPRQISSFLPRIVKGIREVLNDTHEKVHGAALQAIQNIGSVIKCPEIAEILEILVKALSNPNVHLKDALKMLLETSFVHAIDAPSLSLLVPILDSGLMMHDNETKQLASKLMGNICNLTQDPEDLLPYIKILMPAIKNSLFDSIPEIRASAAKALGSLSKGLGLQNSDEMLKWLDQVLHERNLQSSEKQGAAQGFAEIISVHGVKFFEDTIDRIISKSNDNDPLIRESFRSVMVFLATCFDQFVKHLPKLLPIMIQGLSDDVEDVRKISMRNVKICIKQFARQAPNQLVQPIMEMMFHRDFKVRQSSSVLMYQLVKELENDVIKSQPKYISIETKQEILSCMFTLRYDIIERVALQAAQIWKNLIDNQLTVLKKILPVLLKQVFSIIQSEDLELQEMGLNCMRGIVEKFGEKVVSETLDILDSYLERAKTTAQTVGICKAIYNMTYAAPTKLLSDLRHRFLAIVDANLSNENDEIRKLSGQVFITVFQRTYEAVFITSQLDKSFMKKLHALIMQKSDKEAKLLIENLKIMVNGSPELKLEDKFIKLCALDIHETPITIAQARILAAISPKIALHMFKKKFFGNVLNALIEELTVDEIDDEVRIGEVLNTFSELIAAVQENEILTTNEQIISTFHYKCSQKGRLAYYVDFICHYCLNSKVNYEKFASQYLRNVLVLMNDQDDKLVEKVVKSFNAIVNGLQKENQFTHIPLIKDVIEEIAVEQQTISYGGDGDNDRTLYRKKINTIKLLERAEGVKTLSGIIQNSITHGSIDIRIDSAILFQYLIDFSKLEAIKTELIKICGALIRVVNDKFPPQLKVQIFLALKLILIKAQLLVKPMAPQLQTTFLKAFNDSQATIVVRKVVIECLVLFLKIAPKIDPIVKELSSMLDGDKIDSNSKVEVSEILAIIIRLSGKSIQQTMSQGIHQTLLNIVQTKKSQFNEKTLVNCSVALAFLTPFAVDQKAQEQMFEHYDNILDLNVSFGVKYGVLLSGQNLADKAGLIKQLESYSLDTLKDMTGLPEIDGRPADDPKEGEEQSKLYGSFTILGHIGDVFLRRFGQASSEIEIFTQYYRVINQSDILKKINEESDPFEQTFEQVRFYLSSVPVQLNKESQMIPELQQVVREGMEFINNFYLEFESKKEAFSSVINLTGLNYDNYLNINDLAKIQLLTKENAREQVSNAPYASVLSSDLKMLAVELLFI